MKKEIVEGGLGWIEASLGAAAASGAGADLSVVKPPTVWNSPEADRAHQPDSGAANEIAESAILRLREARKEAASAARYDAPDKSMDSKETSHQDRADLRGDDATLFGDSGPRPEAPGAENPTTHVHEKDASAAVPARKGRPTAQSRKAMSAAKKGSASASKTSSGRDAGDELEIRLARMQFFRGAYTRRGINLERHFHPEPLLVTDLDLLSFDVTARLTLSKTIGEAKSGTGKNAPKPLDRAIWIAGLKQLVDADGGIVITALRPSARVRETVRALGVTAISIDDLDRWEKTHLTESLVDVGAHGPTAFTADTHSRKTAKREPELERIYWFLRSEVWFLDSWLATKRLVGAMAVLRRY